MILCIPRTRRSMRQAAARSPAISGRHRRSERARHGRQRRPERRAGADRSWTSVSLAGKTGDSMRRLSRSGGCTSGMPARSSVASSVEDQKFTTGNAGAAGQTERESADNALRPQRKNVKSLLLQLMAQPGLVVGDIDAFDDFAAGGREATAELHASGAPCLAAIHCRRGH
jgi:hypothetical protein